ncbi:titin homolog isoform X1 [Oncorhynchus tshawytscha]|uniref:Rab11 family-interacting protein 1-like n=1 Tax=Oncorhynchus tshawytscha TaxID=74940 RepID=A0A8C8IYF0_ONCTS|nr:titin homolog isoform X1 [Oncorhynchus tshawytscha]
MSLSDQSRQCYPTSVQVTVVQARSLRIKGRNGTNDAYAIMQVAKDKFATSVAENSVAPVWKEEATFELPLFYNGNTEKCTLHVHVMHRALVGPDKLLGQAVINLLELSEVKSRYKTEWHKLLDKAGKPDKDRGEVQVDIQFMKNNMTASMFDLSATEKPHSRLGRFKDKVRGKKEGLSDTASAVVPSFTQVLTDSEGEGEGGTDKGETKKKNTLKSLFSPKSNLQCHGLSQSMSVLGPLPEKNSSLSGSRSTGLNVDSSEGKNKFKFQTHKRTGSSLSLGRSKIPAQLAEQSNLCINGTHMYTEEPQPRSARTVSNFSLASSGHGSMEDLRKAQGRKSSGTSMDSRALKQPSTWAEEEERAMLDEERKKKEEQERKKLDEEERIRKEEQEKSRITEEEGEEMRLEEEQEERSLKVEGENSIWKEDQEKWRLEEKRREMEEQERWEEEERIRREEHEIMRREDILRKEDERKIGEVEERLKREKDERIKEEERIRREQEESMQRREEEERKMREEEERLRREQEDILRKIREEEMRGEERIKREAEEKMKREENRVKEEERRRFEEEEGRMKREDDRLKEEEEEKKRRIEADEIMKREAEENMKREEDRVRRRREEEERRFEEEEGRMKREAEEERMKREEDRLRKEEEERRIEEEERVRKTAEEDWLREEMGIKRMEEDKIFKIEEEDRLRKEEELRKIREKEERLRREEEEDDMWRNEEEQRKMKNEEERRIEQEMLRKEEAERTRLEEEREEDRRRDEEQGKPMEAKERFRVDEENMKKEDLRGPEEEMTEKEKKRNAQMEKKQRHEEVRVKLDKVEQPMKQNREAEATVCNNPFEEVSPTTSCDDNSSNILFEETPTTSPTGPISCRTNKVSAVKQRPSSCVNPSQPSVSSNPFLSFLSPEIESSMDSPRVDGEIRGTQDPSTDLMEKKDPAPLNQRWARMDNWPSKGNAQSVTVNLARTKTTKQPPPPIRQSSTSLVGCGDNQESVSGQDHSSIRMDKGPAPDRPSQAPSQTQREQSMTRVNLGHKDIGASMSKVSQRVVQMITPLRFSSTATTEHTSGGQSSTHHGNQPEQEMPSATGGLRVAKHNKGPAPSRPQYPPWKTMPKVDVIDKQLNTEEHDSLVEFDPNNPFAEDCRMEKSSGHGEEQRLTGEYQESLDSPNHQSCTSIEANPGSMQNSVVRDSMGLPTTDVLLAEDGSRPIKNSLAELVCVPLLPLKKTSISREEDTGKHSSVKLQSPGASSLSKLSSSISEKLQNRGVGMALTCVTIAQPPCVPSPAPSILPQPKPLKGSGGRSNCPPQTSSLPGQRTLLQAGAMSSVAEHCSGEEAGGRGDRPTSSTRRPHPVKPLSSLENQPASNIQERQAGISTGILGVLQEKIKVKDTGVKVQYSQLTQEELISLVVKQQDQLSKRDNKIKELEQYIDNLLVRIIEEQPSILMSMNSLK